jgi:hypothetical protein
MRGKVPCLAMALLAGCASGGAFPGDDEEGADGAAAGADGAPFDAAVISSADGAPTIDGALPPDASPPDAAPCVEGNTNIVFEGHCYMLFTGSRSWNDARAGCASLSPPAHLVTLQHTGENDVVQSLVGSRRVWTGGNDRDVEGVWTWITAETWSYTKWGGGQPDNGSSNSEDCGELRGDESGRWNDTECGNGRSHVCERE